MKITNCVFGILKKDDAVLLVKNLYPEFGPIWGIPGGKINAGENTYTALQREFKEEVNLEIQIEKHLSHFERIQPKRPFHLMAPVFLVSSKDTPHISNNDVVIECKFFDLAELSMSHETIMNRPQLCEFLKDQDKLLPYYLLPPELDQGPIKK